MKNVQISYDLFMKIFKYCYFEMYEYEEEIKQELEKKLNKMTMRECYTNYKTALTEQERETARKKYLNEKGIYSDFRW